MDGSHSDSRLPRRQPEERAGERYDRAIAHGEESHYTFLRLQGASGFIACLRIRISGSVVPASATRSTLHSPRGKSAVQRPVICSNSSG